MIRLLSHPPKSEPTSKKDRTIPSRYYRLRNALPALFLVSISFLTACMIWRDATRSTRHTGTPGDHDDRAAVPSSPSFADSPPLFPPKVPPHLNPLDYEHGPLRGPSTAHFRDSLRDDRKYLTSWLVAGFTNDYMTIGNMIYLAMITSRVPVIPPFTSEIGGDRVPIPFSEIFDLPYLRTTLGIPVLEWQDIKNNNLAADLDAPPDELGCWSLWQAQSIGADSPRGSFSTSTLGLDISYTRAPDWIKLLPGFQHDMHSSFWSLARLAFPETRNEILANPAAHPTLPTQSGNSLPPDDQMLCYDILYYVVGAVPWEYELDHSPMWRFVVQHFKFTQRLEDIAGAYLRRTFNVPDGHEIPPYITVHARRGDFADWCGGVSREQCFPPLSAFAQRVFEVQNELRSRQGIEVTRVIMTGNEKDPNWWNSVHELGWLKVDHDLERTVELYGKWYPVILDAIIQSRGIGFVGTDRSTFSSLARRRVAEWNNGAVRTVKWGRPESDQH
ncbi:uncharacterized protein B0H18DRAFT_990914 [Fomitopsis serialis]|uniref:uncharacterized protein n=1 Tax=Fomitopsis serialis TaxID=139415 RepID=UPI00200794DD|nr:uncharacterized protein B0H18DRAFT_990914 [Neoantrodia serialis]KAH9931279.1 hypothetical protein B0H18DRAFT_990914 [Neoantrodia serialis]